MDIFGLAVYYMAFLMLCEQSWEGDNCCGGLASLDCTVGQRCIAPVTLCITAPPPLQDAVVDGSNAAAAWSIGVVDDGDRGN